MVFKKITGEIRIPKFVADEIQKEIKNIPEYKEKIREVLGVRVTELLEIIMGGAINLGCSDIHIEPEEEQTKIRARIDGILQNVTALDVKTRTLIGSSIIQNR